MSVYVVYKQDQKDEFHQLDRAETEKDGRDIIWAYFAATVFQDNFSKNENVSLFLFKGANNVDGELIVSVLLAVKNQSTERQRF